MRGKRIILLCAIFLIVSAVIFAHSYQNLYIGVNNEESADFTTPWRYRAENGNKSGETALPAQWGLDGSHIELANDLPASLPSGASLLLFTNRQAVSVSLDGESIYRYPDAATGGALDTVPDAWHILRLPAEAEGKEIRVAFTAGQALFNGDIGGIYLGTKSALLFRLFSLYVWDLLFALLVILTAVIVMGAYLLNKAVQVKYANIVYLGLFTLSMGSFFLFNCPLILIPLPDPFLVHFLSMAMLYFIPIPMLIFLNKTYQPRKQRLLSGATALAVAVFIVSGVLQLLAVTDWLHLLPLYIFTIFVYIITVSYISAWEARDGNPHMGRFFLFFFIFVVGLLLDLTRIGLTFYVDRGFFFSEWPVLLFTKLSFLLSLAVLLFKMNTFLSDSYHQIRRSETLTLLAYTDLLTGVQNQKSLQAEIESREKASKKRALTIYLLDIDHLEEANSHYGEDFGNAVLKSTGELILTVFGKDDLVYRCGGDEFIIFSPEINEKSIQKKVHLFYDKLTNHNLSGSFPVSIALVYHICHPVKEGDLKAAVKIAEAKLTEYKNKPRETKEREQ